MEKARFHISLPTKDVLKTKKFYENILGFQIGRSSYSWFDVDVYGNQITFTLDETSNIKAKDYTFEETSIPAFHFGVILQEDEWNKVLEKFKNEDFFAIGSTSFLNDKKGQHKSFFIKDTNDYFLEFKLFTEVNDVFAI